MRTRDKLKALNTCLKSALRGIDADGLDFHASRYMSADRFQTAVAIANDPDDKRAVLRELQAAYRLTKGDGGWAGTIPCLGGPALSAWNRCIDIMIEEGIIQ